MKIVKTTLALAAASGALFAAVPAAAQVNGIATSSPESVILQSQARQTAYQQISQTYQTQIQQASTIRQEMNTLQQSLDTNRDNQLTEAEVQANPGVVEQIEQKEQQIAQITRPIVLAQTYAIEQLLSDYSNAQQQVIQNKNIQIMLVPDAIQYGPEQIDVTQDIVAALDQRVPTVQTTPPEGWQPRRESFALQQQVGQIIAGLAQQQAQQQQQTPPQPTGR